MSGSDRETLLEVQEWSGGPHGCPGMVGRPSRMSGSGRETVRYVWEAFPEVREWSRGPPKCLGVDERPSQMSVSCPEVWETLPDVQEPPGSPGVVRSSSRMSVSGWEALP